MRSKYTIKQYTWNLFVNGIIMSYLLPIGCRRLLLSALGCKMGGGNSSSLLVVDEQIKDWKRKLY